MLSHNRIEQAIYVCVGLVVLITISVPLFGSADQVIYMIQILPIFIPVLIILGAIRFSTGPREHPLLSELWVRMMLAGIILIGAIWMMFYVGLK